MSAQLDPRHIERALYLIGQEHSMTRAEVIALISDESEWEGRDLTYDEDRKVKHHPNAFFQVTRTSNMGIAKGSNT